MQSVPVVQVDVGVDEAGEQHGPLGVHLAGVRGVRADEPAFDHHGAWLGQLPAVEDANVGERRPGVRRIRYR